MIKYINNDYPGFENKSSVIKLDSNFEKLAYEFGDPVKEFIENKIKPTKGSNYYLINAMGAGETYGSNTRGDYFPRKELKENHKTFETVPAYVFVQHRNKDPHIRLGDVLFSHFNDDTDRVELVQRIDWDRVFRHAPDWTKVLLQTNSPYNTSMGCTVDHEYCSYCGKKNKLMNQRCDHLMHYMNQFRDGTRIVAVNVKPRFFDNSIVQRGADKIARSMKKIASDPYWNSEDTILSDYELSGKTFFFQSSFEKTAEKKETVFIKEDTIEKIAEETIPFNKEILDSFLEYDIQDILGVTKIAGAELLPWEYQYIVLKKLGQDVEAENRWENNIRFRLQDSPSENKSNIALNYNKDLLNKFAEYIPSRSFYKPFYLYRSMAKIASYESPKKWTLINEPILSKAYADYVYTDIEKTASIMDIIPFLSSLFLAIPSLMALKKSHDRVIEEENRNIKLIQDTKSRASEIPLIPFVPNPVYQNPLFQPGLTDKNKPVFVVNKVASAADTIRKPFQALAAKAPKTFHFGAPLAAAAAGTTYMASKDKEKELQGDESAGSGIYGFARKHPVLATGVGTVLGHAGTRFLTKKGSARNTGDYKEFLKTASQYELLEFLKKIPDDLFFDLIQ